MKSTPGRLPQGGEVDHAILDRWRVQVERDAVSSYDVQRDLVSDVRHLALVERLGLALDQVATDPVLGSSVGSFFDVVIGFFDGTLQNRRGCG